MGFWVAFGRNRIFQHLYYPNPFACEDVISAEISRKPKARDLYLYHANDLREAHFLLKNDEKKEEDVCVHPSMHDPSHSGTDK